jgi:hypothetical protein
MLNRILRHEAGAVVAGGLVGGGADVKVVGEGAGETAANPDHS